MQICFYENVNVARAIPSVGTCVCNADTWAFPGNSNDPHSALRLACLLPCFLLTFCLKRLPVRVCPGCCGCERGLTGSSAASGPRSPAASCPRAGPGAAGLRVDGV